MFVQIKQLGIGAHKVVQAQSALLREASDVARRLVQLVEPILGQRLDHPPCRPQRLTERASDGLAEAAYDPAQGLGEGRLGHAEHRRQRDDDRRAAKAP